MQRKRRNPATGLTKTELVNQRNRWERQYRLQRKQIERLQGERIDLRIRLFDEEQRSARYLARINELTAQVDELLLLRERAEEDLCSQSTT